MATQTNRSALKYATQSSGRPGRRADAAQERAETECEHVDMSRRLCRRIS
jgi:hypothetical protein